jgi:hypothetical protein
VVQARKEGFEEVLSSQQHDVDLSPLWDARAENRFVWVAVPFNKRHFFKVIQQNTCSKQSCDTASDDNGMGFFRKDR